MMPEAVLVTSPRVPEQAIFSEDVRAGDSFVYEIKRGQFVRIVDLEGNQAVPGTTEHLLNDGHKADIKCPERTTDNRRRYLRATRHSGRSLCDGEQYGSLRDREAFYACMSTELPQGCDGVVR